ncbi:MAG TPA: 50S ribosomal protein L3 [Anaerolineae bacterium]|nr:50S ribosomal protein L3 [Anaerolineae bacterium]
MKGLIGRKLGMTQIFTEEGVMVPVTVLEVGPCYVTQIKTPETDGYAAVQLGFGEVKEKRLTKGVLGHLKRANVPPLRTLREFRVQPEELAEFKLGQKILVDLFNEGDLVDVTGTSKGKGFQGGVKRHNFNRQPKTHGQSDRERAPGSAGAGSTPGRVYKGKRMPGHMGHQRVTVQNLKVMRVDPERNLLAVRGAVPGPKNGLVTISLARKNKVKKAR